MNVIAVYGDRAQVNRMLDMPAIKVTLAHYGGEPGNLYMPGPHDLQAVAAVLNGAVFGDKMPLWELRLEEGKVKNRAVTTPELQPSTLDVIDRITRGVAPSVMIIQDPWLWYPMVIAAFSQNGEKETPLFAQARAQIRVAETMGLLANSPLTIIVVADEAKFHNGNGTPSVYNADLPRGMREYITHDVRMVGGQIYLNSVLSTPAEFRSLIGVPYIEPTKEISNVTPRITPTEGVLKPARMTVPIRVPVPTMKKI